MYDTGEYYIQLSIPTNNYVVRNLFPIHLESISTYVGQISVQNNDTLIVLLGAFQCIQVRDFWVQPLDEFSRSVPNPVIVFTGKLTEDFEYQMPNTKFGYYRTSMFEAVSNLYWSKVNPNKNWIEDSYRKRNKKFYWASTKDWYTRRYILSGLIQNNLLDDGLVNYKCVYTDIPGNWLNYNVDPSLINQIEKECDLISNRVPLPHLDNTVEFYQTNIDFYLDSFLGIVTDTFYDQGVFFSEKIFNAMNYQQLFFYFGYQGSLQYLKNKGYEIFDDIIDTSYDNIAEPGARLIAARKSLLDFLNQPIEKIRQAYEKKLPAIIHNKNHVQQQRPDLEFTNTIQNYLNEH